MFRLVLRFILTIMRWVYAIEKLHFEVINRFSRRVQSEFHVSRYLVLEAVILLLLVISTIEAYVEFGFWDSLAYNMAICFLCGCSFVMSGILDRDYEETGAKMGKDVTATLASIRFIPLLALYYRLQFLLVEGAVARSMVITQAFLYLVLSLMTSDEIDRSERRHLWSFLFA